MTELMMEFKKSKIFKESEIPRRSKRLKLARSEKLSNINLSINSLRLMVKPLNRYIDYTNLKPDSTKHDIQQLCKEAFLNDYFSICVNSSNVRYCLNSEQNFDLFDPSMYNFP